MRATSSSGWESKVVDARAKEKQKAERQIAGRLGGDDELVEKLFLCLGEGVVKRREIAAKLGISLEAVTNCRKRLNRKLAELAKTDGGVTGEASEECIVHLGN